MIDGNELRLGNYVFDRDNKLIKIDFIEFIREDYDTKFGEFVEIEEGDTDEISEFASFANGINITEDWLSNFGFKQVDNQSVTWSKSGFEVKFYGDFSCFRFKRNMLDINYVHELQNIYYLLKKDRLSVSNINLLNQINIITEANDMFKGSQSLNGEAYDSLIGVL